MSVITCFALLTNAMAQPSGLLVAPLDKQGGAVVGSLRILGDYARPKKAWTSTVLNNGNILMLGDRILDDARKGPNGLPVITLRERFGNGNAEASYVNPHLWRADKRAWQRLPRSPGCMYNHFMPSATLMNDGRVLIAGGLCDVPRMADDDSPRRAHVAMSIWNESQQRWDQAPDLVQSRLKHSATLLTDGSVLFAGGISDPALKRESSEPVLASVERFHAGVEQIMAPLLEARAEHTATLLLDGSVLVAGGQDAQGRALDASELWEPVTQQWRRLPPLLHARYGHSATRLADGRVLVTGGRSSARSVIANSEVFDLATQRWTEILPLPHALSDHSTLLLPDGSVLLVGGRQLAPAPDRLPWVWLLDAQQERWHPAGDAAISNFSEWQSRSDLQLLPDGRVRIFAGARALLWQRQSASQELKLPFWSREPAVAALADGRVMVVGTKDYNETLAYLWNPVSKQWSDAGRLGYAGNKSTGLLQLQSGLVIHMGVTPGNTLTAECWRSTKMVWSDCGNVALTKVIYDHFEMGLLDDGRMIVVPNFDEGLIYDESAQTFSVGQLRWQTNQFVYGAPVIAKGALASLDDPNGGQVISLNKAAARFWEAVSSNRDYAVLSNGVKIADVAGRVGGPQMLWDNVKGYWTYVLLRHAMGRHAAILPDGCAISVNPPSLFDPVLGKMRLLPDPGMGVELGKGRMVLLPGGTVVVTGTAPAGVGDGFYQGQASCGGFAADIDEALLMQTRYTDDARYAIPATPNTLPPVAAPTSLWQGLQFMQLGWQPGAALAAAALLLALASYLFLIRRRSATHSVRHVSPKAIARRKPTPPTLMTRVTPLLVYGALLVVAIYLVRGVWEKHQRDALGACKENTSACVDQRTGLMEGVPGLDAFGADKTPPQIPCRFVGSWSTVQQGAMFRITLLDDGRFHMDDNAIGLRSTTDNDGFWMVQSGHFVWRYPNSMAEKPDVNRLLAEDDKGFDLQESSGRRSRFNLIERKESKRCVR